MELGIVINELNDNVPVIDAYSYNVSLAFDRNFGDRRYSESGLGAGPDTDQRVVSREEKPGVGMKRRYNARFLRPIPPLFIEPVLTSPADYIHLGSLPKRAKLDEYYVRSTVPGVVYDSLLKRPHNVAVSDPLNALGRGDNSIVLMKSNLYGPDVREKREFGKGVVQSTLPYIDRFTKRTPCTSTTTTTTTKIERRASPTVYSLAARPNAERETSDLRPSCHVDFAFRFDSVFARYTHSAR